MGDIAKCDGEGCPRRGSCRRYTVEAGPWQSWFDAPPGCEDGGCDYHWSDNEKERGNG
jgi:hypothetical protein